MPKHYTSEAIAELVKLPIAEQELAAALSSMARATGSRSAPPLHGAANAARQTARAVSSAVERFVYTEDVGGSIPSPPTSRRFSPTIDRHME